MKTCRKCNALKEESEFTIFKKTGKSYFTCKACQRALYHLRNKTIKRRVQSRKHWQNWQQRNMDNEMKLKKRVYIRGKMAQYIRDPKKRAKYQCRWATQRAIKTGVLIKLPCENCGDIKSQAHHNDYNYPLIIQWLCAKCHRQHHLNERDNQAKKEPN